MRLDVAISPRLRFRISPFAAVLLALMGIAFIFAVVRYIFGIGAISNLSDAYPWGFWISFDIFTGIAISSGAFLLAAAVYIFDLKEFRPLLTPSLLTALLGYVMEVLALMVDLGHPERIWYMMIRQNFTSNMLVVGLCVMIYLIVLAIEFAPTFLDGIQGAQWASRLYAAKWATLARRFMLPVVIFGVVISTIHQGSLASLLIIQPAKLFPLWWTPILPVLFFISAVAIGLAMIIFESSISARYFHRGLEMQLLDKLGRAIPFVLAAYLVVRFTQLALSNDLQYLFSSSKMSLLFWAEILLGSVSPLILFSLKRIRQSSNGILASSIILLIGMILNRFNVSWFAVKHPDPLTYIPTLMANNAHYWPTLPEVSISVGIFSFGILIFGLAAKYLPLFELEQH